MIWLRIAIVLQLVGIVAAVIAYRKGYRRGVSAGLLANAETYDRERAAYQTSPTTYAKDTAAVAKGVKLRAVAEKGITRK